MKVGVFLDVEATYLPWVAGDGMGALGNGEAALEVLALSL